MSEYAIGGVVGRGLLGPLRAARYLPTGLPVILEDIPAELARDTRFTERLATAGKAAAAFRHPSAVAVFNLVDDGGQLRLVTEWVDGVPLSDLVPESAALPPASALAVADGVLAALNAAHTEGLAHGGVGREAVVITADGDVRLRGFGVAAALHADQAVDPACDLVNTAKLTAGLLGASLDSRPGGVGPERRAVLNVLRRAAAPDPMHRYRSAAGMRQALLAAAARSLGEDWRSRAGLNRLVQAAAPNAGHERASPASLGPPRASGKRLGGRLAIALVAVAAGAAAGLGISAARGAQPPAAVPLAVTGTVSLHVSPAAGTCGTSFTVRASAPVRGAGSLVFRWERSDGGATADTPMRVTSADASFSVAQTWLIQGAQRHPWITFDVVSPALISASTPIGYSCP